MPWSPSNSIAHQPRDVMAFVDAAYLCFQGQRSLRLSEPVKLNGPVLQGWARSVLPDGPHMGNLIRVYVYEGQFDRSHPRYEAQDRYFRELATSPYIRLRLGRVWTRGGKLEQKGVDTLLVLDLVRLAQLHAYDTAILVAGDGDFAEPLRVVADDYARRTVLCTPKDGSVADDLRAAADVHGEFHEGHLRRILQPWTGDAQEPM